MFFGPPQAGRISRCLSYGIAVLLCGGHLGGADASAPPFPFILHTLHVPPLSFGVRLLTSNRSVMRSTTTTMTPKKIFLTPFKLKMASNGSMVTLRPQKSSHVGWFIRLRRSLMGARDGGSSVGADALLRRHANAVF